MLVLYDNNFYKDICKITDNSISKQLLEIIETIKTKDNISEIHSIKKLSGYQHYYRIRLRDYRIGLKYQNNVLTFIRFLHRKDIYKYFPQK